MIEVRVTASTLGDGDVFVDVGARLGFLCRHGQRREKDYA